ncbi:MAG: HEAT repeat domain-containing protein [Planctomycetota bacterium]|nr:HEAT repeat domain-containing protein [Planctomycetota bacterium]
MKRIISMNFTRCSALLTLFAMGPLWAQTSDPASTKNASVDANQNANTESFSRRVLKLKNGQFVRTACSLKEGKWMLSKKDPSKSIPAMFVEQATLEKDLIKRFKRQSKSAAPGTLPAWCLQHGLLKEGLRQLDEDLGVHALRAQALEALAGYEPFLPTPPQVQALATPADTFASHARWLATKNTSSLHELAARNLARLAKSETPTLAPDETAPWERDLVQVLTGSKPQHRDLALSTWAQWQGQRSGQLLRRFAMLDRNEGTRDHAANLLGHLENPAQVSGLIAWLDHDHAEIRMRAASALGHSGYPAAVPALVAALGSGGSSSVNRVPHANIFIGAQTAYVQDFDVEVANRSSIADPVVNVLPTGVVLDAGVVSIAIHRQRTTYHKALNRITGHRPGTTEKAWTRWLQKYETVDTDWRAPWPAPK